MIQFPVNTTHLSQFEDDCPVLRVNNSLIISLLVYDVPLCRFFSILNCTHSHCVWEQKYFQMAVPLNRMNNGEKKEGKEEFLRKCIDKKF